MVTLMAWVKVMPQPNEKEEKLMSWYLRKKKPKSKAPEQYQPTNSLKDFKAVK